MFQRVARILRIPAVPQNVLSRTMGGQQSSSSSEDRNGSPGLLMKSTIKTIGLKFPAVKSISTNHLATWLATPNEKTVAVVDCRPDEEYSISHIEGAIHAGYQSKTPEEILAECEQKLGGSQNSAIVCYCSVGYRSSDTVQNLIKYCNDSGKNTHPEILNLEGSLFKWAQERRPMVDGNGQGTQFVHPYSGVFGKLVDKELRKAEH